MFISVTRLRVRRWFYLPQFLWYTLFAKGQARKAAGFLGGNLLVDARCTFRTLTVWENERAMKAYRGTGAHSKVMPRLMEWCDEASYTHWESPDATVPEWPEAHNRMVETGKLSRVAHPSPAHEARQFAPPRLKPQIGGEIKAKTQ